MMTASIPHDRFTGVAVLWLDEARISLTLRDAAYPMLRVLLEQEWNGGCPECGQHRFWNDGIGTMDRWHSPACQWSAALSAAGLVDNLTRDEARRALGLTSYTGK